MGSPPLKVGWLCKSKSLRPIALGGWNFLCRFQKDMALSGNFCGPMHYVLPGEKTQNTTSAAPVMLRLVSKNHKKIIQFSIKVSSWQEQRKWVKQAFQILTSRTLNFLVLLSIFRLCMIPHFLLSTESLSVILLFVALSLSSNIEGQQYFSLNSNSFLLFRK